LPVSRNMPARLQTCTDEPLAFNLESNSSTQVATSAQASVWKGLLHSNHGRLTTLTMPGMASTSRESIEYQDQEAKNRLLRYSGHAHFRHRLVLSLLTRKPIRIDSIRPDNDDPGLKDFEVSFLRMMERISNGTVVEISYTGTSIYFAPGSLLGGTHIHICPLSKSVGWFLEPILALAPFCKKELILTLKGITTDANDASVDTLRLSCLPHLAIFLPSSEGLELRITKRGHPPLGGGEVTFRCPVVKQLKPGLDFIQPGQIAKIRGIAHSLRVSPQFSNRLMTAARGVLNTFIPDIYIYTDVYRGEESGKSPGYALTLVSTSTTSVIHSSEATSHSANANEQNTPEDIGIQAAYSLLAEIASGGCVDRGVEALVCTLMALGKEGDLVRCRIGGPLSPFLIGHLRDLRDFTGITFKIRQIDESSEKTRNVEDEQLPLAEVFQLSCVGSGFISVAAKIT